MSSNDLDVATTSGQPWGANANKQRQARGDVCFSSDLSEPPSSKNEEMEESSTINTAAAASGDAGGDDTSPEKKARGYSDFLE